MQYYTEIVYLCKRIELMVSVMSVADWIDYQVPMLRDNVREGYVIRYSERKQIPMQYVERREVPTGWLNVSGSELTAVEMSWW